MSGAEPGCGPTLASNDAARPTLGLPLLVALRAQVTTGHSVGRGHSRLMLWAARASVACSCLRSGASPPLLDNAFRARRPVVVLVPVTGQALIAVFSSLLAILMRRGLAFSATGMVNRSTPSW